MTPRISLITAVTGLALVLAVPVASGKSQPVQQDFWNYDQQTGEKIANASPGLTSQDLGTLYSAERSDLQNPIVSPDAVDRAVAARRSEQSAVSSYPDVVERAVAARNTTGRSLVFDNHRLTQPTNADRRVVGDNYRDVPKPVSRPTTIAASDSGREIEWPQIGMGFGLGILLAIGLFLAMRYTRIRPLAH